MSMIVGQQQSRDLEALLDDLRTSRGVDLSGYKRATLWRRINRRMQQIGISAMAEYVDYLRRRPDELQPLLDTILINVTSFYRDPQAWELLAEEILPVIVAGKPSDAPIRVWSAGCASGQEAFTLAMVWAEHLGLEEYRRRVKIYATDVDEDALNKARHASYAADELDLVPPGLRSRYFERAGSRYNFRSDARRSVIFGRHDLIQDAPISRVDLLVCRNTLIYLNADIQKRIFDRFRFALSENGFLFLGKAEMLLTHGGLFHPVDLRHRFFSKALHAELRDRLLMLPPRGSPHAVRGITKSARLGEKAAGLIPVPQLVADAGGLLLQANQPARQMFGLTSRDIGRALRELELADVPVNLPSLTDGTGGDGWQRARATRTLPDGRVQHLSVKFVPLQDDDGTLLGISVVIEDQTAAESMRTELTRCSDDLATIYERLQVAHRDVEASSEQLHATAQQLDARIGQLRALEQWRPAMDEMLQASNREIHAGNARLEMLADELHQTQKLVDLVVCAGGAAMVIVDPDLKVLFWNGGSQRLWRLSSGEAAGKKFGDLPTGLSVSLQPALVEAFLAGDSSPRELIMPVTDRSARATECRIVLKPVVAEGAVCALIILIHEGQPALSPE